MKRFTLSFVVMTGILFVNCAPAIRESYSPDFDFTHVKTVAVLPFCETYTDQFQHSLKSDLTRENKQNKISRGVESDQKKGVRDSIISGDDGFIPVATYKADTYNMTAKDTLYYEPINLISQELMGNGLQVSDSMQINRIISMQQLNLNERFGKEKYIELGKLYNADIIVIGNIALRKFPGNRSGDVYLRVIETSDGEEIYNASLTKKDPWGGANIDSFRKDLIIAVSKKLGKFLKK